MKDGPSCRRTGRKSGDFVDSRAVRVVELSFQPCIIAVRVLEKRFGKELAGGGADRLKTILPAYGVDLTRDADACRDIHVETAAVLRVENV